MRYNEDTAISTSGVILVPYDRHHVLTYHKWMEDPDIQEATASERLTVEEEYENQESWRASHDKLTFIICQPLLAVDQLSSPGCDGELVESGVVDLPDRMIGDINFFLYPWDESEGAGDEGGTDKDGGGEQCCVGEVDIMIADHRQRGRGIGKAAVSAFLFYIRSNLEQILEEHVTGGGSESEGADRGCSALKMFMVKIKADNAGSIALFKSLGFEREGPVNYFGEVKMVLRDIDSVAASPPPGYRQLLYHRPTGIGR